MSMDKDLPLAIVCGLLVGIGMYWFLAPDWFIAAGTAAVYAGAGYFYFAFDTSGSAIRFDGRVNRLGYAIGLFGLSVSPVAFAQYYGQQSVSTLPIVIIFIGVIAFVLFSSNAQQQNEHRR